MEQRSLDITFPTLPSTISKVEEFIASGQTDPDPLVDIVQQDPSVSVNVLRRVNSAYYGMRRDVESIDRAVRLLGFVEVSSIVMIEGVNELQEHFRSHSRLLRLISHTAVFTGRFAQRLSRALDVSEEWVRIAFSGGFICAMGRLILLHSAPDRYDQLSERGERPLPDLDEEEHTFGVSHRTLAPQAAEHWELPERICSVLRIVADPTDETEGDQKTLAVAIRAGSSLARQDLRDGPPGSLEGLGEIQTSAVEELVIEVAEDASTYASEVGHL